jgi:AcrR family transcriptional regulator
VHSRPAPRYRAPVAEADNGSDGPSPGLVRLPPGRHGLPREFVVQNQRDRLTAGMIAVVAELGYHDATVSRISAAAGVSRRTFYGYFKSKQDCYFATFDVISDHMLAVADAAGAGEKSWPRRVRAAIGAVLEAFASNPDLARFVLIEPPRAGDEIAERLRSAGERALDKLAEGIPKSARVPSPDVQRALLAGMAAIVARKVEAGEGGSLLDLLPELVELFLTPFIGHEKAASVARS